MSYPACDLHSAINFGLSGTTFSEPASARGTLSKSGELSASTGALHAKPQQIANMTYQRKCAIDTLSFLRRCRVLLTRRHNNHFSVAHDHYRGLTRDGDIHLNFSWLPALICIVTHHLSFIAGLAIFISIHLQTIMSRSDALLNSWNIVIGVGHRQKRDAVACHIKAALAAG